MSPATNIETTFPSNNTGRYPVGIGSFYMPVWKTKNGRIVRGDVRPSVCPSVRVFRTFFQHALRYQFERVSSQSGHPDLLNSQEWVKVIFLHLWPQKLYRAFRFGTLWPISYSYPRHSQLTRHSLMLANGRIRQSLTALVNSLRFSITKMERLSCWSHDRHWSVKGYHPANTQRNKYVIITSKPRFDVIITCLLCSVFAAWAVTNFDAPSSERQWPGRRFPIVCMKLCCIFIDCHWSMDQLTDSYWALFRWILWLLLPSWVQAMARCLTGVKTSPESKITFMLIWSSMKYIPLRRGIYFIELRINIKGIVL